MTEGQTDDRRRERLRFRSWHRGTREMDLLLGSFADLNLPGFTPVQLDMYEHLLEDNDPDLYAWMTGQLPVPANRRDEVLDMFCAFRMPRADEKEHV